MQTNKEQQMALSFIQHAGDQQPWERQGTGRADKERGRLRKFCSSRCSVALGMGNTRVESVTSDKVVVVLGAKPKSKRK